MASENRNDQYIGRGIVMISTSAGEWRSLVMEIVLTTILVSVIRNTATGSRSVGHNAAIAVGATVRLLGLFASRSAVLDESGPHLGPDVVSGDFSGWWVYVGVTSSAPRSRVMLIILVRGMPRPAEQEAAKGGDVRVP